MTRFLLIVGFLAPTMAAPQSISIAPNPVVGPGATISYSPGDNEDLMTTIEIFNALGGHVTTLTHPTELDLYRGLYFVTLSCGNGGRRVTRFTLAESGRVNFQLQRE